MKSRWLQLRPRQQSLILAAVVVVLLLAAAQLSEARLSRSYYASTCPNVEALVRGVVTQKLQETFNAAPGTLRLFFHDCFVRVRIQRQQHRK
jgi:peroxidase